MIYKEKLIDQNYRENIQHMIENRPFSIHHTQVAADNPLVLYQHWHEEIEIFYLEQGEIEFIIEDSRYVVREGEGIIIPPNLLHMAIKDSKAPCSFYAFVFSPVLFQESYTNAAYTRFVHPLKHNGMIYISQFTASIAWQDDLLVLLKKLLRFYGRQDIDTWELELHGLLFQVWNLYYQNHMTSIALSSNYTKLYNKLYLSLLYIHRNYSHDITIQVLADQSGLCIGTFCRYFKELTGLTPFTYLTRYRIRKSCEELLNSRSKITEVASQCGFNNISHFNRAFLQHVKCRPSEYRKQNLIL